MKKKPKKKRPGELKLIAMTAEASEFVEQLKWSEEIIMRAFQIKRPSWSRLK